MSDKEIKQKQQSKALHFSLVTAGKDRWEDKGKGGRVQECQVSRGISHQMHTHTHLTKA